MMIFSSRESRNLLELLDSRSLEDQKLAKNMIKSSNKTLFLMDTFKRTLICSILAIIYLIIANKYASTPPDHILTGETMTWVIGFILLCVNSIMFISKGKKYDR